MNLKASLVAGAALAFATHSAAGATSVVTTVTGVIGVVDHDFYFGGLKTGDSFKAVFTFDTSRGALQTNATEASLSGNDDASPMLSIAVSANGKDDAFVVRPGGTYYGSVTRFDYGTFSKLATYWQGSSAHYVDEAPTDSWNSFIVGFNSSVAGSKGFDLASAFTGTPIEGSTGFNRYIVHPGGATFGSYKFQASVTSVSSRALVPEPSSWAMMIGGFGLIGAAARRRQLNVTYA